MATLTYNTSNLADNKWHKIFLRVDSFVSSSELALFLCTCWAAKLPGSRLWGHPQCSPCLLP